MNFLFSTDFGNLWVRGSHAIVDVYSAYFIDEIQDGLEKVVILRQFIKQQTEEIIGQCSIMK